MIVVLCLFMLVGCTDSPAAKRVLTQQGYTQVQTTGLRFFTCGEGDLYRTGFTGKSPAGINVEGTVCSGIFKGHTIRLD